LSTLRGVNQRQGTSAGLDEQAADGPLRGRLKALVLLSGLVRSTDLSAAIGRSVLDLPIEPDRSILDCWCQQVLAMVELLKIDHLPVRVMIDSQSDKPTGHLTDNRVAVQIEEDASAFRGTAGVLRDIAGHYGSDDLLLVANGAQIMLEPLADLMTAMAEARGDISIVSHADGTPSGMMLVRCGALEQVPEVGFVDMKEQALPKIANRHRVAVVKRDRVVGMPIRSQPDYILALRSHHGRDQNVEATETDCFAEAWQPTFRLIETDAQVDDSARVHDSVVLSGATVERGAVLVQSVICPGAIVRRNQTVTDQLVEPPGRKSKQDSGR